MTMLTGKTKIILIIALVIVIIAAVIYFDGNMKVVEVDTVKAIKGDVSKYVEEMASVKSRNHQSVYTKTSGDVNKIHVEVGDIVSKGDVLAELDSEDIGLRLKSLISQLSGLKATYREAAKPVDDERIKEAEANLAIAKINLEEAQRNIEKNKSLYEEEIISYEVYNSYLVQLSLSEQSYNIALNELNILKKGISDDIKKQYESQIAELQYQIQILENSKEKMEIMASTSGVITEVHVKKGQFVQPGVMVAEIADENKLYLEADVLVSEVGDIKDNASVIIYSEDLDIRNKKGLVSKIYPKAFSKISDLGIEQKRVKLEISLEDKIPNIKIGYNLDVNIITDIKEEVLIIPDSSIFELDGEKYVFTLENNIAVLRKVEVLIEGKDNIGIASGLEEGEIVILSPDNNIEEGIQIKSKN